MKCCLPFCTEKASRLLAGWNEILESSPSVPEGYAALCSGCATVLLEYEKIGFHPAPESEEAVFFIHNS
jgi:hypothetical protein